MEEEWFPDPRQDVHVPITNAIERKDLVGARKLIKKRMEKSSDTIYPALLCLIQARHPLVSERGEAMIRLQKLADEKDEEKERITDLDDLEIYEHAYEDLAKGGDGTEVSELIGKIRVLAVQAIPRNEKFAVYCLKKCMTESNFDVAFKIAQSLAANFPKNRNYLFYLVLIRLLLAQAPHLEARLRGMTLALATRGLETWAKATIDAKGSALPFKSLQNAQEILLYHRALKMSGKNDELIAALLSPIIGVHSDIIQGDWSVIKSLVDELHASDAVDASKTTINLCVDLLEKACANVEGIIKEPMYGDWAVWDAYVDAIMEATNNGTQAARLMEQFFEVNNSHRNSKPAINKTNQRNARLAYVKFMVMLNPCRKEDAWTFRECAYDQVASILEELEVKDGITPRKLKQQTPYVVRNLSRRTLAIVEYLHEYGHVTAAFTDIKPYFQLLDSDEREQLLGISEVVMVDRRGWICEEQGKDDESPDNVNFPPTVSVPDQVTAVINHFKFSYLNSHISQPLVVRSEEEAQKLQELLNSDYTLCSNCKLIGVSEDGPLKVWSKKRSLCCESCLRVVALYGMAVYDHALNGWAKKAWRPFHMKATDMHPGDDAVIMVAMALIKLGGFPAQIKELFPTENGKVDRSFAKKHSYIRLVQAAAILEFAHSKSPANPQVLLLLVRLYSVLGAGSLAMRAYTKLNLKQIQSETLGYVLLDRISTLHPHPCYDIMTGDEPVAFDPAVELAKLHHRYRGFKKQITRNYMTCLEHGKYGSIFQLTDVHEKLYPSIGSVLSVVELRQLTRMRNPETPFTKSSHGYDILPRGIMNNKLQDNIDYKSFPSFELPEADSAGAFVHVSLETGPPPSDERMRAGLLVDELMMLIKAPFDSRANMTQLVLDLKQSLDAYRKTATEPLFVGSARFTTPAEYAHYQIAFTLCELVTKVGYRDRLSIAAEDQLSDYGLAAIRKGLQSMKQWTEDLEFTYDGMPNFHILHPLYTRHQTVTMVLGVEKLLAHPSFQGNDKTSQRYRAFVMDPAKELLAAIKKMAKHVKATMDNGGYIDVIINYIDEIPDTSDPNLTDDVVGDNYTKATIGRALRRVLTPEFTEIFASELAASWNESIIGLQCLV